MKVTLNNFPIYKYGATKTNSNTNASSSLGNSSQTKPIKSMPMYNKAYISNTFSFKGLSEPQTKELNALLSLMQIKSGYSEEGKADVRANIKKLSSAKNDLSIAKMLCYGFSTENFNRTFDPYLIGRSKVLTEDNFDFAKELMTATKENGEQKYNDGDIECILYSATQQTIPWMKNNMDFVDALLDFRDNNGNAIKLDDFSNIIQVCTKDDNADFIEKLINLKKEDSKACISTRDLSIYAGYLNCPDAKNFLNNIIDKVDKEGTPLIAHKETFPVLYMLSKSNGEGWSALQFFKDYI